MCRYKTQLGCSLTIFTVVVGSFLDTLFKDLFTTGFLAFLLKPFFDDVVIVLYVNNV